MAISFGDTWWGKQWLGALNRIDYSNRLPRGKSYANKGAVTSIKIKGNQIEAKVQGTRKTPYKVNIVVPPYFEEDISVFMKEIKSNPLVLAKLLNRELPQELMEVAERNGIKIFPSEWQDIKLNCSCPDWAVPCKHLAAVIYIIANEIDKNPFLVFKLHGFDILEHLKEMKDMIETEEKQSVLNLSKMTLPVKKAATAKRDTAVAAKGAGKGNTVKEAHAEFVPDEEAITNLDFSVIPDLSQRIISLFPQKTLFFNGDFHKLLSMYYRSKIKSLAKPGEENGDISFLKEIRNSKITVILNPEGSASVRYEHPHDDPRDITLAELCQVLQETSPKHIRNYSVSYTALYYVFHFCRRLLKQGAVLPQLVEDEEGRFRIRWIPALIDKEVKIVFDLLCKIVPPDICLLVVGRKDRRTNRILSGEENLKSLCACLLDFYFKSDELPKLNLGNISAVSHNEKVARLFFLSSPLHFDAFTEKEIPNSIQVWLNRFNIARKEIAPILAVDERNDLFDNVFDCRVLVEDKNRPFDAPIELKEFLSDESQAGSHFELIKDLAMLAEYMPELQEVIKEKGHTAIRFDNHSVVDILQKTLPALELFGIRILLPKSLRQILKPQVSFKVKNKKLKSYLSIDELLDFDWRIALGEHLVTEEEFKKLAVNAGKLVRIKDSYTLMTEDEIKKVIKSLSSSHDMSSLKLLQSALSGEYNGAKVEVDDDVRKEINKLLHVKDIPVPESLRATLRPYQLRGYSWMYKNARLGFGSLLADDMGLGKTLQVITVLLKFKSDGCLKNQPALVVVPTTLLSNWEKEIQRFAPDLNVFIYYGSDRKFDVKAVKKQDVVITSYGMVRSDVNVLKKQAWYTVIIDEAQNIKNNETAQTKAVKQLKAKVRIAMSGTPVENRLSEYWSIFDFSNTGYLGNLSFFTEYFAKPIELNKDRKKLDSFHKVTQPFLLRREKTDKTIISDLPDKIENNRYCVLSPEQISLYKQTVEENLMSVEESDGMERQGLVLKLLSALKQICNHPSQYLKKDEFAPSLSGKTEMLLQLLDNIYESGEKVLIFSQYAEMGAMLLHIIHAHFNKKALFLHGGCTRKQRDEMVDDFQSRPDADTFILSLKAGGTGLNLTAAANVIHFDLWWNPAVEAQATDRAFRIGQKKNVMVYRFITQNTLEEKIDAMMQSKKELAGMTIKTGESWIGNLSDKDLKDLITLTTNS
ncbi:MAG TPA: helicase SNF2 [Porphyromonadaceae bacterium]|nr:helicase SNF2 [Porphyromonadaceae bacterium]